MRADLQALRRGWFNREVHETADDLAALQALIDRSYAAAGEHLLSIRTPERRLTAAQVSVRLQGMCLLALATVTATGEPRIGPVDGIFLRGAFHFGSAPHSARFRHLGARPAVSATYLPGEELAITVHGRAVPVDVRSPREFACPARHLRPAVRAGVGGLPRLGPGLRADRGRADVHLLDAARGLRAVPPPRSRTPP
ncbi:pyridoxamine 5'-phosphate oxidase family protein [Paraconexibacter antarcticus]|uniref:Pyridoxamine 5'-phosphate oxidase family protein n=1 Tax=Paraconexibacter antarcticus TaxID=2949664 RepID=A0ABY5DQI8_9ACTN|nr:pyridoxamine 5'-phosphate oxidase family protein [Paraconexibacter antarcticus]UTI63062.1 pyridoxamine 5'-phosphate oxidase family protein [Paraconexibacter antarcticus]